MPTTKSPRKGSLQFWPRKRANKFLPSVNWEALNSDGAAGKGIKGFICYKAGMLSVSVKDNTENSMTKGKKIVVPVTVLECPPIKIFSVRFYKNGLAVKDVLAENLDKELKRKVKIPKKSEKPNLDSVKTEYDDIKIIAYSQVKKTSLKKKPDMVEIGLNGSLEEKLNFVKERMAGKELSVSEFFEPGQLVDFRGLTTGRGLVGPVKRFGIKLKASKSEKGRRRPGSLGPWHPARVIFRVPMAGQLGMFTRAVYNSKIIGVSSSQEKPLKGIKNYGDIKSDYILVAGSVQGPSKRQLVLTQPLRESKMQKKKNYEFLEVLK